MTPVGGGGDENRRERGDRVWLQKEGEGDAIVVAVGVVVVERRMRKEM